ncbi:hypothetical protein AVEN_204763-1 [Araneus ventricosus]|uniref:Uncharacterized protein n=1 Tax=Araneus ventricosus TaxID=182803 RepID=A0A4Y2G156_ARAVE|nr:hypothetical protein AVEN_204763-1 [Araneus ventricosus]
MAIRSCFRLGGFIRIKQEDDPYIIERPADLFGEDKTWIKDDSNLEKAERLQKKQNAPYTADLQWNRVSNLEPSGPKTEKLPLGHRGLTLQKKKVSAGRYRNKVVAAHHRGSVLV